MTTLQAGPSPSPFIAAEIRAQIARQGTTAREVAARLNRPAMWLSRRIGKNADVDLTFEEVMQMTQVLGVKAEDLIVAALCACRDSNPKPSVLESDHGPECWCDACSGGPNRVIKLVTPDRRVRSAWTLAS